MSQAQPQLDLTLTEPDYGGSCVTQILPPLVSGVSNSVVGQDICEARAVVLLVIDGMGWLQLKRYANRAPLLSGLALNQTVPNQTAPQVLTTVAPSTTCAAMTSITTGAAPAEHGLVGLTLQSPIGLLNPLRWTLRQPNTAKSAVDARQLVSPESFQPIEPFASTRFGAVTRTKYAATGFTAAHLRGARFSGWKSHRQIVPNICELVERGERLVFGYYDGLDKAGHLYGLTNRYLAVLAGVEEMVKALVSELASDVAVLVTADHGMLDVTSPPIELSEEVLNHTEYSSGEARWRWLHAKAGRADELLAAAEPFKRFATVMSREQVLQAGWLGAHMSPAVVERLGDVALIARDPVVVAPAAENPRIVGRSFNLIGHHGALTAEEMLVPLATFWGNCVSR